MIEFLYSIDKGIFYFFNGTLSSPFLDKFFSLITNVNNWYIAYFLLLGALFVKGGRKGKIAVLAVIILIVITDQLSAKVLKDLVARVRPCNVLPNVKTPLGLQGTFSFPSNHAVNNFAAAIFFMILYPNYKVELLVCASLVAISRIYIGLHYPSDVVGGALIGAFAGYLMALLVIKIENYYENRTRAKANE